MFSFHIPFLFFHTLTQIDSDEIDAFSVDKNSGKIKLVKPLDSNYRNHYRLIVKSEDDSEPPKSDTAEVCKFFFLFCLVSFFIFILKRNKLRKKMQILISIFFFLKFSKHIG